MPQTIRLNLGGEGEEPGIINQQPEWQRTTTAASRVTGQTFGDLLSAGHAMLFCDTAALPFPDDSVAEVVTNNVPIDVPSLGGRPGIPAAEIRRVLSQAGVWRHDGTIRQP